MSRRVLIFIALVLVPCFLYGQKDQSIKEFKDYYNRNLNEFKEARAKALVYIDRKEKEIRELKEKCSWAWTTKNGVNGYKVTGPNGNSIFLPAAGYRNNMSLCDAGADGDYWSATLGSDSWGDSFVYYYQFVIWFDSVNYICGVSLATNCYHGKAVRPVSE